MSHLPWQVGLCWLCRRDEQRVLFIGPVEVNGLAAPGFACEDCIEWSRRYVHAWNQRSA